MKIFSVSVIIIILTCSLVFTQSKYFDDVCAKESRVNPTVIQILLREVKPCLYHPDNYEVINEALTAYLKLKKICPRAFRESIYSPYGKLNYKCMELMDKY